MDMSKSGRNYTVDLLRFVAAWGVIVVHVTPGDASARAFTSFFTQTSVPFFVVVSLYYLLLKRDRGWAALNVRALLLPYVSWSVIYLLVKVLKYVVTNEDKGIDWLHTLFFGGASTGLYFLPMLLYFQVFVFSCAFMVRAPRSVVNWLVGGLSLVGLYFFGEWVRQFGYLGFKDIFRHAWVYAAVACAVFVADRQVGRGWLPVILGSALFVGLILKTDLLGAFGYIRMPLAVAGLLWAALSLCISKLPKFALGVVGSYYGIYLVHQLFDRAFEMVLPKLGVGVPTFDVMEKLWVSGLILVGSCLLVAYLKRFRWARVLLLGQAG